MTEATLIGRKDKPSTNLVYAISIPLILIIFIYLLFFVE